MSGIFLWKWYASTLKANSNKHYSDVAIGGGGAEIMYCLELDFDDTSIALSVERAKHYRELVYEQHLKTTCIAHRNLWPQLREVVTQGALSP